MTSETWRPVLGWPCYEVSSAGRVRSLDRKMDVSHYKNASLHTRTYLGRVLQETVSPHGHRFVYLYHAGRKKGRRPVHRLVLEAFVGPCPDGMEGCHNDGDPSHNEVNNLRWDTHRGNAADRVAHGTLLAGEAAPWSKLTASDVAAIRSTDERYVVIAARFGISKGHVCRIRQGLAWKAEAAHV